MEDNLHDPSPLEGRGRERGETSASPPGQPPPQPSPGQGEGATAVSRPPAARTVGLVGLVDSPGPLLRAAERFRDAGFPAGRWDCHTPYPVHGLDQAMGLKPSTIGYVTIPAAFTGLALAVALTGGLSAIYYPVRIGGKPMFSWQAFVPIFFELFVLLATVSTMAAIIIYCRLGRWHSPLHDSDVMKHITRDRFAVVLRNPPQAMAGPPAATAEGEATDQARRILEECGFSDIRPLVELEEESEEEFEEDVP